MHAIMLPNRKLDAGNNKLIALPIGIGRLTGLRMLELRHNQITELPSSIGNLCSLRNLFLEHNALKQLPVEIGKLSQLRKLLLSHNNIEEIPSAAFEGLTNLAELMLSYNKLQRLPAEIGICLSSLTVLSLSHNELHSLPAEIGIHRGSSLTALNLQENPSLHALPLSFTQLTALEPDGIVMPLNDWMPVACAVGAGETERAKLKRKPAPSSLFDICCQKVCRVQQLQEVQHRHQEVEKEGDDVSKILSGEWEITPGGLCVVGGSKVKQPPLHRPLDLPAEVEEKLEKDARYCDGCGNIYFGQPAVSGVVAGEVARSSVWLRVACCSRECAAQQKWRNG